MSGKTGVRTPAIWFVGGGTGGHLAPGMALAEWLLRKAPVRCQFLTSGRKVERTMLAQASLPALEHPLPIPDTRWNRLRYGMSLSREAAAMAVYFVRARPAAVVGLGAYGSVPAALAAVMTGVPLFLLEQNTIPGKANRLLARWASEIYLQWEEALPHFPATRPDRLHVLGNPVRAVALRGEREAAARHLGLDPTKKTLLVMGGSQGSHAINEAVAGALPLLARYADRLQCLIITGERDSRVLKGALKTTPLSLVVLPFVAEIGRALAVADLAICRAGGTTIAELLARGVPSILVPYPRAADGHQSENAAAVERQGACVVLAESEMRPLTIRQLIEDLLLDPVAHDAMAARAARAGKPQAVDILGRRMLAALGIEPVSGLVGKGTASSGSFASVAPVPGAVERAGRVHLVGAGGSGVSALGRVYLERGWTVSGSDARESPAARGLIALGATITVGHREGLVHAATDHLVVSASITADNPELLEARRMRIPVFKYAEALGRAFGSKAQRCAVAGTHGKTTTSGWTAYLLSAAGQRPSFVVGAVSAPLGTNAAHGEGRAFVVEACEFDRSFHQLFPTVAIVTNVEADHLDYYQDLDEIRAAFVRFASNVDAAGLVIAHESVAPIFRSAGLRCRVVDYGALGSGAAWQVEAVAEPEGGMRLAIHHQGALVGQSRIKLAGEHNALNALAATLAVQEMGVPLEQALELLGGFAGASRRLEFVACQSGMTVLDDYAHHPTEIRAVIAAIRGRYGKGRRVTAVFQPHQHSRTRLLLADFCGALALADRVIIPDIYAARDQPEDMRAIGGADVVRALEGQGVRAQYIAEFEHIVTALLSEVEPGEVVVTMGAGDVDRVATLLRQRLEVSS